MRHTVVRLSVIPSFTSVLWRTLTMSHGTSNARYYLTFQHLKLVYEALFSSYGVGLLLAIWSSP